MLPVSNPAELPIATMTAARTMRYVCEIVLFEYQTVKRGDGQVAPAQMRKVEK
jgi:hypothetical protein